MNGFLIFVVIGKYNSFMTKYLIYSVFLVMCIHVCFTYWHRFVPWSLAFAKHWYATRKPLHRKNI